MKKQIFTTLLFVVLANAGVNAQVGIGVSTANVNPSAQLDVSSTTKGLLPPRMTTTQRDAINGGSPAEGLVIFNTTKNCMQYKSDTGWVSVIPSTGTSSTVNDTIVTIGSQIWATKNLNVNRYRNGDLIPQVTDLYQWGSLTTGAWCWFDNDSVNYAAIYGRLYNWHAVNDPRGLAPVGWHIPSSAEWTTLTTTLGGTSVAGGALKSTTGWAAPNTGATNSSGFAALPGGYRGIFCPGSGGTFNLFGSHGFWWTSTNYQEDNRFAQCRELNFTDARISTDSRPLFKYFGHSVRCIKD